MFVGHRPAQIHVGTPYHMFTPSLFSRIIRSSHRKMATFLSLFSLANLRSAASSTATLCGKYRSISSSCIVSFCATVSHSSGSHWRRRCLHYCVFAARVRCHCGLRKCTCHRCIVLWRKWQHRVWPKHVRCSVRPQTFLTADASTASMSRISNYTSKLSSMSFQ